MQQALQAPPSRFPNAGAISIESMLANAMADRANTKRVSKYLTDVKGTPVTQYLRALVAKRFGSFRVHILQTGLRLPPMKKRWRGSPPT